MQPPAPKMTLTGTKSRSSSSSYPYITILVVVLPSIVLTLTSQYSLVVHLRRAHIARYNPWRAPGYAPVFDPCGMAGGTPPQNAGPGEAKFAPTPWAKQGDLGSKVLAKGTATATWSAGADVEVSWAIRYNHGGGYQYRLCPASEPLTEECFKKTPLAFSGQPRLKWNDGTSAPFKGVYVTVGTSPPGSAWAMNPIPRINPGPGSGMPDGIKCSPGAPITDLACRQFNPTACKEVRQWKRRHS